jgi:hypothetical protein
MKADSGFTRELLNRIGEHFWQSIPISEVFCIQIRHLMTLSSLAFVAQLFAQELENLEKQQLALKNPYLFNDSCTFGL